MRNAILKLFVLALLVFLPACSDDDLMAPIPAIQPVRPQMTALATAKVSAGQFQTCALRSTGIINCWGDNTYYQSPFYWAGDEYRHYVDVSTGDDISCGVTSDGNVNCRGQDVTVVYPQWMIPWVGTKYIQVTTGEESVCALRDDGLINCRGRNQNGQTLADWSGNGGTFKMVATNENHTCAIRVGDGAMECRGSNANGAAPAGPDYTYMGASTVGVGMQSTCQSTYMWAVRCIGAGSVVTNAPGGNTHLQVTVGSYHACALQTNGSVKCWGSNGYGEAPATRTTTDGVAYTQVDAGDYHTCAMRADDLVECWGFNNKGQAMSEQGISFKAHTTTAQIGDIVRIEVKTTSGLGVSFNTSPGYICAWHDVGADFIELELLDSGSCSIQVSQGGNASFHAAQNAYTSITVDTPATPDAPSNAVATSVAGAMTLTWNDNSSAETSFALYQRSAAFADAFGDYQQVYEGTAAANATSFPVGSMTNGNKYQFAVQACRGSTCSALAESNVLEAPPLAPSAVVASVSGGLLRVNWADESDNEVSFKVARRVDPGTGTFSAFTTIATLAANSTQFTDGAPVIGNTYQYRILACNAGGCSEARSNQLAILGTPPAAPTGFAGSAISATSIRLTWVDASNNEGSFKLERRVWNGSAYEAWVPVGTKNANSTSFDDNTVTTDTWYQYRISACNVAGCSARVIGTKLLAQIKPTPPTNLVATVNITGVYLVWTDASNNESSFRIERQAYVSGSWTAYVTTDSPGANMVNWNHTTIDTGKFRFRIRACNAAGCSTVATSNSVTR